MPRGLPLCESGLSFDLLNALTWPTAVRLGAQPNNRSWMSMYLQRVNFFY
jgi:hypothetical protein